jgi:hypothetical protein
MFEAAEGTQMAAPFEQRSDRRATISAYDGLKVSCIFSSTGDAE